LVATVMFAGILGCLYLLLSGLVLTTDGDVVALSNSTNQPAGYRPEIIPPAEFEPIEPPRRPGNQRPIDRRPDTSFRPTEGPESVPEEPAMPEPTRADAVVEVPGEKTNEPMAAPTGAMPEQELVAEQQALQRLEDILRSGGFSEMSPAIIAATSAIQSESNKAKLAQYAILVELADYYVAGIRKGSAAQTAGESFELSPGIMVGVVEGTEDRIILKLGRNKSYTFDEFPLVLAHRLAEFSLPLENPGDSPEAMAGRAIYQALWSQATDAHRRQAIDWLNQPELQTDRFSVADVRSAIERLFPN
jgi:hypothetical protein